MKLREQIEMHRTDLIVKISRTDLRILTDSEAIGYRQARQEKDVRSLKRNVRLGARVDRSKLTEVETRRADCLDIHIARHAIEADRILRESRRVLRMIDAPKTNAALTVGDKDSRENR